MDTTSIYYSSHDEKNHLFKRFYLRKVLSNDLLQIASDAVYNALAKAESIYECEFPVGDIRLNLKGRAAGQVRYPASGWRHALPEVRLNLELMKENLNAFIQEVIPHECAHLVVYRLYNLKKLNTKVRPKPHGKEWQAVMLNVYSLQPTVTHSFDVKKNDTQKFQYRCACIDKAHHLSIIRHNKIRRQVANYLCRACGQALKYVENHS